MSDPTRILDETEDRGAGAALKRSMLRAARREASPSRTPPATVKSSSRRK